MLKYVILYKVHIYIYIYIYIYISNTIQIADTNGPIKKSYIYTYYKINVRGPLQYKTKSNIFVLCFDLLFIKFLINTREKTRTAWS